ncbi:alpha/beta fold hydrolase [Oceaniserpentilla sp. 4NH20-0058]
MGTGEPIIALHGLSQHSAYWMDTGIAEALSKHYRVIALDYRGHGLTTITGEPTNYNIETCVDDLHAFADHLGLKQFHLMGHSTGGMIATRYAMQYATNSADDKRLLSLILCNTSPTTQFSNLPEDENKQAIEKLARSFEDYDWPIMIAGLKHYSGPLFAGVATAKNSDELFAKCLDIMKDGNGKSIGEFVRSFYNDSDPRTDLLKQIICPTLVITAEKDHIFCKTSQYFTDHIPNIKHEHKDDCGHMTNVECPDWMNEKILNFLQHL